MFQFLGRNSGRSDESPGGFPVPPGTVSIPRSEFWSFGLVQIQPRAQGGAVSIPRSEFWSFGPKAVGSNPTSLTLVSIPRSEFWSFGRATIPAAKDVSG